MLIKVKTLTGKEIEIDIEPTDRVERIKVISNNSHDSSIAEKIISKKYPKYFLPSLAHPNSMEFTLGEG